MILGLAIGGGIGAIIAKRVAMTSMPQLVAAFHSLVGMAAVLVAAAASMRPEAFGIGDPTAASSASLIEMSLGVAIGAITFTGSVIAFAKLNGRMSGAPIMLPARHIINIGARPGAHRAHRRSGQRRPAKLGLLADRRRIAGARRAADHPDRRRRHAGRGLDAELLFRLGGGGIGFTLGNLALIITGALVGSSGAILSYIMCKAMNRSFISVILGGFGGETAAAGRQGRAAVRSSRARPTTRPSS
jgi:NAD(P) transhydrogenase subunit beta